MYGAGRDAEFAVSTCWLVDNRQELFQGQGINGTKSDAGSTAVAAIVIDDEQVTLPPCHIEKEEEGLLQSSPTPSFPLKMINRIEQEKEYVCLERCQQQLFKSRRVWSIVIG